MGGQMRQKNFRLLEALWDKRITQCELIKSAGLSSEARLSRIINRHVEPTVQELAKISAVLNKTPDELGFQNINLPPVRSDQWQESKRQ
jgi:transcriptional regulator with XRE-family HTH domain